MKILGIDYGEKRIGLAVSDETGTFARELTILSPKEFLDQIHGFVATHEISKIVVGWPLNMSGEETKKTKEVGEFIERLRQLLSGVEIDIMDERLSSQMAQNITKSSKNLDSLAAQILLQNYLDKNKNSNQQLS